MSAENTESNGVHGMGSLYAVKPGERWWMVQHRDNSDHGRSQHYFEDEASAIKYADRIELDRIPGDHFHPAPEGDLQIMVFRVERFR